MSRSPRKNARRKIRPEFLKRTADEFIDYLTRFLGETSKPEEDPAWPMLIDLWLTHYTPRESRERLSVFLRDWVRRDACRNRVRAQSAAGVAQLWEDCFEPLTMALGGPGNIWPDAWENQDPTRRLAQADFDRRLANWLRDVIRQKRVSALKSLAKALELLPCDLSMGITAEKIKASVGQMAEKGSGLSRKRRIMREFRSFVRRTGRLPTKAELRAAAGLADDRHRENFRGYLRELGLSGLPKKARSKA